MADKSGDAPGNGVATEDALEQVAALKARVSQDAVALEETNRRLASVANEAVAAREETATLRAAIETTTATSKLDTDLETANRELDDLGKKYEDAFSSGDAKQLREIQTKMALAGGRIATLQSAKEAPPVKPATDAGRVRPAQSQPANDREAFIQQRSAPTAAWLRQHPEFFDDKKVNARVRAADMIWESDGKAKDTPEYFNFIEKESGLAPQSATTATSEEAPAGRAATERPAAAQAGTKGAATDLTPAGANASLPEGRRGPPQQGRPRQQPVAAPPNRDGAPNLSGRGDSAVKRITPEMQAWAKMMYPPTKDNPEGGIDAELYYDEYTKALANGEINDRFGNT